VTSSLATKKLWTSPYEQAQGIFAKSAQISSKTNAVEKVFKISIDTYNTCACSYGPGPYLGISAVSL
jgi:hypothetical protein